MSDRFPSMEELEAQAVSTLGLERLARRRDPAMKATRQEAEPAVMPPRQDNEPAAKARQEPGQWPDPFLTPSLKLPLHQVAMHHCEAVQTRLWLSNREGSMDKVTTFVGATAGCGTSTVAANFAGSLAQAGGRILLIAFGDAKETVVSHRAEPSPVPLPKVPNDEGVPAWTSRNNPGRLYTIASATALGPMLRSEGFDNFLALSRERFDHVVIDAPALQGHPETLVLCRKADAVVLVIRAGQTRNHSALWTRQQIQKARGNLAGVVLNRRKYYVPDWIYRLL